MKKWRVRVKIIPELYGYGQMESDINEFLDSLPNAVINDVRFFSGKMGVIAVITYKEQYEVDWDDG